jgi:epoxyqueuosine reductase
MRRIIWRRSSAKAATARMDWMANNAAAPRRSNVLWPQAKTIIVLGINYGPRNGYHDQPIAPRSRAISVYAQGDDYHEVMKAKLKRLAGF